MLITELWAEDFKSFGKRATVPLSQFTLLIGPNNAGKSNILEIPRLLRMALTDSSWTGMVHGRRTEIVRVGAQTAALGAVSDSPGVPAGFSITVGMNVAPSAHPAGDVAGIRKHVAKYDVWALDPARMSDPCAVMPETTIRPDGLQAPAVLDHLRDLDPQRYEALQHDLRRCAPEVDRVVAVAIPNGLKEIYFIEKGGARLPCRQVSEGLRFLLFFLMILHGPEVPQMLAIEDIERGLHPRRIKDIVGFLRQLTRGPNAPQILATTHSPLVLDEFRDAPEDVVVVERPESGTVCQRLSEKLAGLPGAEDASLGDLWYSGVFGGVPGQ